ncbi:MAG TPA: FAD-dependent oxidoreductase [Steroidobacteraceae bacterium]|jgi:gamma-glutamylputrescine oxidase|nr:FAD-dependent oxidoreductase [Steroidobacteraceae bacterium]
MASLPSSSPAGPPARALAPYPPSYYSAVTPPLAPSRPLQGSERSDVCVVGGGIAGCSAALALAERGYRVTLLEAQRLGWGASGRNGGQVLPGIAVEQPDLAQIAGDEAALHIWRLSLEAVALTKQRLTHHAIACDWQDGQLLAALKPRQWQELQRWQDWLQRQDYSGTQLLGREALGALLESPRYLGALYDPAAGHLQPLRYTLGLAEAAMQAGVTVHEASQVIRYELGGAAGRTRVHSPGGEVTCDWLIFAGNAWLGETVPSLTRKLIGVGSYIIATEPLGAARARRLIANNAAVCDTNWILDYFHRSADDRLLFGGRVNYSGLEGRAIGPATRRRMLKVFPQLDDVRIDYAWGCLLDITMNRAPHFGRLAPNVFFLQGFSGHGIALTGLAGQLIAEAVAGSAERFDVFARLPHRDFPGGRALRRPLLALAMLWYRLRDLL